MALKLWRHPNCESMQSLQYNGSKINNMPKGIFCGKGKGKKLRTFLKESSNKDLREFTGKFFCALKKSNPVREERKVSAEDEILDVMARLLVGDEKCAAIAISGHEILLATNEPIHIDDSLKYQKSFKVLAKYPGRYVLEFTDTLEYAKLGQPTITIPRSSKPVIYQFFAADQEFRVIEGNPNIEFSYREFGVEGGAICVRAELKKDAVNFNLLCALPINEEIPILNQHCTPLNPLRRRTMQLIRNLALIAHSILTKPDMEKEIHDYFEQHNKWASFLGNSLSYELAQMKEYREYIDPYSFSVSDESNSMNDMFRFYEWLNADYQRYRHETRQVTSVVSISEWLDYIAANIQTEIIPAPAFIKRSFDKFIEMAKKYLVALVRIENFVTSDAKKRGKLAQILVDERLFEEGIAFVKVIDGITGVHAEMRLLEHHLQNHPDTRNYYGITMLCCALCTHTMKQFQVVDYRGSHTTLFGGWGLGQFLEQPKYLKVFLGEELWSNYEKLREQTCQLPGDKQDEEDSCEKTIAVLEIIPAVSGINFKEAFEELHIPEEYLLPQPVGESLYPHDVDDAEEAVSKLDGITLR